MVRVLHRHLDSVKLVTVDQGRDFGGVVIRQHEIGRGVGQQLEQSWMVDLVVGIEPPAGTLAARRHFRRLGFEIVHQRRR